MIYVLLDKNKVILEFPTEEEARLFYSFLKSFKQISWKNLEQDPNQLFLQIKLDKHEEQKYILYLTRKNNPVRNKDTIKKYVTALKKFAECAEYKITPDTLLKCVKNKHYERAIRNYIHMKYYYREIPRSKYIELLERVPRFREEQTLAQDRVPVSEVLISLAKAKKTKYKTIYYALFYTGGARLRQLIETIQSKHKYTIINNYVKITMKGKGTKKAAFLYLPYELYNTLINMKIKTSPKTITNIFRNLKLIPVTLIRSFCWQTGKQIIGQDLMLLLQGRLGELKKRVTATSYDDLIFQLDISYQKWKQFIDELITNGTENKALAKNRAKNLIDKYKLLMPI